jgi:hypothetical protein
MNFSEWQLESSLASINDSVARIDASPFHKRLRENCPLRWGQTAAERERMITDIIVESWSWR